MRDVLVAFVCGATFAIGLALAGMTEPGKVVAFLDFFGNWDPSLALVMGGAIAVYMPLYRRIVGMRSPFLAAIFELPATDEVDRRVILGSSLFGIGWGISGFCPGPALASLGAGASQAAVFVACMAAGMLAWGAFERTRPPSGPCS